MGLLKDGVHEHHVDRLQLLEQLEGGVFLEGSFFCLCCAKMAAAVVAILDRENSEPLSSYGKFSAVGVATSTLGAWPEPANCDLGWSQFLGDFSNTVRSFQFTLSKQQTPCGPQTNFQTIKQAPRMLPLKRQGRG